MNFLQKNVEKILYILVNISVIALIAAFCVFNFDRTIEFTCPVMQKVYTTKLTYLVLMFVIASYAAGAALCALLKTKSDELCNAYQKRHESISAAKDSDSARIAALEAKIQTLETALDKALKNK